jgi:hypothetical protein
MSAEKKPKKTVWLNWVVAGKFYMEKQYTAQEVAKVWGTVPEEVEFWRKERGLKATQQLDGSYTFRGFDVALFLSENRDFPRRYPWDTNPQGKG